MKIYNTPIPFNNISYFSGNKKNVSKIAFKSKNKKTETSSHQKNDPDFFINPASCYYIQSKGILSGNNFDTSDVPIFNSEFQKFSKKKQTEVFADYITNSLVATAEYAYKQIPDDKKDTIPTFIRTDTELYFKNFDKTNENIKNATRIVNSLSINTNDNSWLENMPDISLCGKFIKEKKLDEVQTAFEKLDLAQNYKYMQAFDACFEQNPRKMINILSNSTLNTTQPTVKDNNDGTSKYIYSNANTKVEITKNNKNGDFIDFAIDENIKGSFNPNGTINELTVKNKYDGSVTNFTQKQIPREKIITVTTNTPKYYLFKIIEKTENDDYRLTDLQMFHN